ncbi:septum formation protein Maf [Candidatus Gottesmanbacteria bacterium]|nr:septum formation protein Maf [Candidatus Gottesmanbacteria bacterium]
MRKIILASSSPRRKHLLEMIGLKFTVHESKFKEVMDEKIPADILCKKLAYQKAKDVAKSYKDALVIGADTFVILDNKYIGKAKDDKQAYEMLLKLSGKKHIVITAFAIIDSRTGKHVTESIKSNVYFRKLSDKEINFYVASAEPIGKAAGYAIQGIGGLFVDKIEGEFFTVVGLPIGRIIQLLPDFGVDFFNEKKS